MKPDLFRFSFFVIYLTETTILQMTLGKQQASSLEELKTLNMELHEKLIVLQKLQNAIKFLKILSHNLLQTINGINDDNKLTAIEIHNVPSLNFDEQYMFLEKVSEILFHKYDDREIAGVRVFFTNENLAHRKMMVALKTYKIKSKWFATFINLTRRLGYYKLKEFPGLNISLYSGTVLRGITLKDHLSKHKSSLLKVAQGFLTKFQFVKCIISNSLVFVERQIGHDKFIRYLLRNFEDVKILKEQFLKENVPTIFNAARVDITPNPLYVIFTKKSFTKDKQNVTATFWKKPETHWRNILGRGNITNYIFYESRNPFLAKHRTRSNAATQRRLASRGMYTMRRPLAEEISRNIFFTKVETQP